MKNLKLNRGDKVLIKIESDISNQIIWFGVAKVLKILPEKYLVENRPLCAKVKDSQIVRVLPQETELWNSEMNQGEVDEFLEKLKPKGKELSKTQREVRNKVQHFQWRLRYGGTYALSKPAWAAYDFYTENWSTS